MKKRFPIVALAQIKYNHTGKHNVEIIKKYIKLAGEKNADIVCFPETCINRPKKLPLNHRLIKEIQETCKENSIWAIITDYFVTNKKIYKMAILIDRKGKIKGKYKKIHLYGDNAKEGGKRSFVYKTDFAKIGIVICWDLAFPKLFKQMKKAGAEIIFCSAQWCYETKAHKEDPQKGELNLLKSIILSRAFENLNFVAVCNPVTEEKDLISYSAISSPHKILSEIKDKEGLITARLNLNEIKKFSKIYPGKGK
jgi:predicted amidohydrolase